MNDADNSLIETKTSLIMKDLESAFQTRAWYLSRISTMRGWAITLTVAYSGFIFSQKLDSFWLLLPIGFALLQFASTEATNRWYVLSTGEEIRAIEKMFMEEGNTRFADMVGQYEFRDLRERMPRPGFKTWEQLREELTILAGSWYSLRIWCWHVFLFALVFVILCLEKFVI